MHVILKVKVRGLRLPRSCAALACMAGVLVSSLSLSKADDVDVSWESVPGKVAFLIEANRRPEAASLLYEVVRKHNSESYHCQFAHIAASIQAVRQHDLLDEIIRIKRPLAGASFAEVKDFTITLVHLTTPGAQRDALKKLHVQQPDDARVLTLLVLATPSDELEPLIEPVLRFKPPELISFLKMLTDEMRPYYDHEERFVRDAVLVEWLAKLFTALPVQDHVETDFLDLNHLALDRCRISRVGEIQTPSLSDGGKDVLAAEEGAHQEAVRKIVNVRDRALERLAWALLRHPSISAVGFNLLYRGRDSFPVTDRQLYEAALAAIACHLGSYRLDRETLLSRRFTRLSHLCGQNFPIMYFGVEFDPFPDDYAAAYAKMHQISQVPAMLLEGIDPIIAPVVREWIAYFARPDAAVLTKMLASLQAEPSSRLAFKLAVMLLESTSQDMNPGMELILERYDFASLLEARPWAGGLRRTDRCFEEVIGRYYVRHPDHGVANAGLRRIATSLLGPEEAWPGYKDVFVHHWGDNRMLPAPDIDSVRLSAFAYLVNHESQQGRIRPNYNLLRFANTYELPRRVASVDHAERIYNYQSVPVLCTEVMMPSNLLVPGPGMFDLEGRFIPPLVVMTSDSGDFRRFGEELLKAGGPDRFWETLTGALWMQRDAAFVLPALERELPSIVAWPKPQQRHLANFLLATWPMLRESALREWIDDCIKR